MRATDALASARDDGVRADCWTVALPPRLGAVFFEEQLPARLTDLERRGEPNVEGRGAGGREPRGWSVTTRARVRGGGVRGFDQRPAETEQSRRDRRGDHKAYATLMLAPTCVFDHALLRVRPA